MGTRYGPVKLRVPKGFPILLQRFAREVLREQPQDIPKFGAEYFRKLLDERYTTGEDPLKADPFDEPGFKASSGKVLRPINSETRQKEIAQENAATKIQAGYRGYRVRKQSVQERQEKQKVKQEFAATKIQAGYRGYRTRRNLGNGDNGEPTTQDIPKEETPRIEKEYEAPQYGDEHENAAVRIQANYRGYQTRKSIKRNSKKVEFAEEEPIIDTDDPQMETAALKIQASFRGHKTREQLKEGESAGDSQDTEDVEVENEDTEIQVEANQATMEEEMEDKEIEEEEVADTEQVTEVEASEEPIIDTNDPEMEAAALKIQASFRGHKTRKQLEEGESAGDHPTEDEENRETVTSELGGGEVVGVVEKDHDEPAQETAEYPVDNTDEQDDDAHATTTDNQDKNAAATKIQAQYRGYKTRKQIRGKKTGATEQLLSEQADDIVQEDDQVKED